MSASSSSSRPFVGSPPSLPSSPTIHYPNSATIADRGDGRSKEEYAREHDLAYRKKRHRQSAGFLLDPAFPSGPRSRRSHHPLYPQAIKPSKSKQAPRDDDDDDGGGGGGAHTEDALHELQQDLHDQQGQSGQLQVNKMRKRVHGDTTQPQSIDSARLVHMALNLSESRRRNLSTSQLLAAQSRLMSSSQQDPGFFAYGAGHSLRQYLNQPRQVSRNISPMGGKTSPSRHVSVSMPGSQSFHPSAATLARADKARTYIELRMEYLRMLLYLPPLNPDANAPGNFITMTSSIPGSYQAHFIRVPSYAGKQHDLGRPYNPLQYIRNRRTRVRERRSFYHSSNAFLDLDQVREWVDRIEEHSKQPDYRGPDQVQLPKLHDELLEHEEPSKVTRSYKGWVCSPEELFADAYWLEQEDNKKLIENRHGIRIFPSEEQPWQPLQPRTSKEHFEKNKKGRSDGRHGLLVDPPTGDESEQGSERGRKRRLLPTIRAESPKGWHRRQGSRLRKREDADTSGSDAGLEKRRPLLAIDTGHNTGPLALLMEQHAREAHMKASAFVTPDTPDKWDRGKPDRSDVQNLQSSFETPGLGEGLVDVEDRESSKKHAKVRPNLALLTSDIEPRSSFEDFDSTAPTTPLHPKLFPRIGDDLSPPVSRASSQNRKSKRSKLAMFHSHERSEDNKDERRPSSTGREEQQVSWQSKEEAQHDRLTGIAKHAVPSSARNLLSHRKNASATSLPSPETHRRKETQEPHSAVTRFFKGMRQEGTKVGEFIFRKDRLDDSDAETLSEPHSIDCETDTSAKIKRTKQSAMSPIPDDSKMTSVTHARSVRPNVELPVFRSVRRAQLEEEKEPSEEHYAAHQARDLKNNHSSRFDKLGPPTVDLRSISRTSSKASLNPMRSHSHDRINERLAFPGGANSVGLVPTALRKPQALNRVGQERGESQPDWNIADDKEQGSRGKNMGTTINQADIARVRTILLSSGIKARELSRWAHIPRSSTSALLTRAAVTTKTELFPVPRKEEHVLAARILMKDIEYSTQSLRTSLEQFRSNVFEGISTQISQLQSRASSDLMPRVLSSGDSVVHSTGEVSGQGPLEVQQITDEIDRMLRARRRRLRWMRRLGWILVEWAVVAFMWWLWFIVVLLGCVRKMGAIAWGTVRWLLWI